MCYWFTRRGTETWVVDCARRRGWKQRDISLCSSGHPSFAFNPSFHFTGLHHQPQSCRGWGGGSLCRARMPHLSASSGSVTRPIRRCSFTQETDIKRGDAGLGSSKWRTKWQSQNKHTGADRGCKEERGWTVTRGEGKSVESHFERHQPLLVLSVNLYFFIHAFSFFSLPAVYNLST